MFCIEQRQHSQSIQNNTIKSNTTKIERKRNRARATTNTNANERMKSTTHATPHQQNRARLNNESFDSMQYSTHIICTHENTLKCFYRLYCWCGARYSGTAVVRILWIRTSKFFWQNHLCSPYDWPILQTVTIDTNPKRKTIIFT